MIFRSGIILVSLRESELAPLPPPSPGKKKGQLRNPETELELPPLPPPLPTIHTHTPPPSLATHPHTPGKKKGQLRNPEQLPPPPPPRNRNWNCSPCPEPGTAPLPLLPRFEQVCVAFCVSFVGRTHAGGPWLLATELTAAQGVPAVAESDDCARG